MKPFVVNQLQFKDYDLDVMLFVHRLDGLIVLSFFGFLLFNLFRLS